MPKVSLTLQNDSMIHIEKLNTMLDPAQESNRKETIAEKRKAFKEAFGKRSLKNFANLFELLWYSRLPCFDIEKLTSTYPDELSMIKKCWWKNTKIDCPAIFDPIQTDKGMCCAFNYKMANEMYKESIYNNVVENLTKQDHRNR